MIPDDDIMQHRSMAALTLVQKHIRQRDMAQLLDKLTHLLMLEQMSGQQITVLVNYRLRQGMPKILGHSCTGWHSACRSMEDY